MVSGKYSALSGAITREQSIANTSANLANVTTPGYKKTRMSFESILRGEVQVNDAKGINYNRVRGNYIDFSQGPLQETHDPFDVAITGDGFFKVRSEEGDLLTRNGSFIVDNSGRLLTESGMAVLNNGGAEITIPDADISRIEIDKEGLIYTIDPEGESTEVSQLAIVDVEDRSVLENVRDTAYTIPQGVIDYPAEKFDISQGYLEISNVNMTEEMAKMLNDRRLFETYHNVIESFSKMNEKLDELGTLS